MTSILDGPLSPLFVFSLTSRSPCVCALFLYVLPVEKFTVMDVVPPLLTTRLSRVQPREPLPTPSLPLYFVASLLHSSLMFSRPRKLDTEQDLYDYALRILMRRAHSVHEMKTKLLPRADSELLAQVVLARLKESGKLDDSHYAKQFARQRSDVRKQGKFRIARDLRARGVPDRHINAAIAESADSENEIAVVRQRIERKLRSLRGRGSGLVSHSTE